MSDKVNYPVFKARWVMGSPTQLKTTDHKNNPEPNENKHHWFIGLAVPKGAEWDSLWSIMYNAAANNPACTTALCGQIGFNWKTEDCDNPSNPENKGKDSYPAGHMIIKFARYKQIGPVILCDGNYQQIVNPASIKRGDYFHVSASTLFNDAKTVNTNAGMYQNIEGMMFAGPGAAIVSEGGFDAKTAFAGVQGASVQGGQSATTPLAATTTPVQQAQQQQVAPPPATDLVTPGATIAPPPPPVQVDESYNVEGKVYTKSQLLAMPGWTEAHLVNLPRA